MIIIRITERDRNFLYDLYKMKFLNSKRIGRLYGNYRAAMRRLKIMEESGYVRVIDHLYSGENVYCVTKKACSVLGLTYDGITKTDKLIHYLACTDFYFSVKNKGVKSVYLEYQYYFNHNGRKYSFRPDLVIEIDRPYLVEIDLSGKRFESKVESWETFYESDSYRRYFDKYPPIIIVSTQKDKIMQEIERIKRVDLNYVYKDYEEVKGWEYRY